MSNYDPNDNPDPIGEASEFDLNFNGVGDWGEGFPPLPEATYTYVIAEAKPGRSAKNNPKVTLTLTVEPTRHPEYANRKVWDDLTLTPAAMPRVKQALSCIMQRDLENETLAAGWWNELIGLTVRGVTIQEPYTPQQGPNAGKTRINNKIKGYLPSEADMGFSNAEEMKQTQASGGFQI